MQEAVEQKAQKDQEHRERREHEKCEKKEREEREAREEITCRIREVGKAVAEVARGMAKTEQEQVEREQEALRRMRMAEYPTEAEDVPLAKPTEGSGEDRGSGRGVSEDKGEEDSDGSGPVDTAQRTQQRQVICSRQNTAKVVIVRPAAKGKGTKVSGPTDEVSLVCFSAEAY